MGQLCINCYGHMLCSSDDILLAIRPNWRHITCCGVVRPGQIFHNTCRARCCKLLWRPWEQQGNDVVCPDRACTMYHKIYDIASLWRHESFHYSRICGSLDNSCSKCDICGNFSIHHNSCRDWETA